MPYFPPSKRQRRKDDIGTLALCVSCCYLSAIARGIGDNNDDDNDDDSGNNSGCANDSYNVRGGDLLRWPVIRTTV